MASASTAGPSTSTIDVYRPFPSLKGKTAKFTSSSPFTPSYIEAHTPTNSSSYTNRIQGRQILLENPVRESQQRKDRIARKRRQRSDEVRRKAGIISKKDAERLGAWKVDRKACKYEIFLPIHHMWCSYIAELLSLQQKPQAKPNEPPRPPRIPNALAMQAKLVKAEFHGAILEVSNSRNKSLIGCRGIVIHETENTFKIICPNNTLKMIPKENSVFTLDIPLYAPPPLDLSTFRPAVPLKENPLPYTNAPDTNSMALDEPSAAPPPQGPLPNPDQKPSSNPLSTFFQSTPKIRFDLYGNHFRFRSSDRATRKFKPKETIEI